MGISHPNHVVILETLQSFLCKAQFGLLQQLSNPHDLPTAYEVALNSELLGTVLVMLMPTQQDICQVHKKVLECITPQWDSLLSLSPGVTLFGRRSWCQCYR